MCRRWVPVDSVTVRLGIIAAARIAGTAVVEPSRNLEGVEVVAVAARSAATAAEAARRWGVERWYGGYESLLEWPGVDAVYVATPAALHSRWAVAALERGLHTLCEKPLAANAADGAAILDAERRSRLVAMEAMHWRYHPLVDILAARIRSIGPVVRIDASFTVGASVISESDIRWDPVLGGGSMMDLGVYPVSWARWVVPGEPTVESAVAVESQRGVDGRMEAELVWDTGERAGIEASMIAAGSSHRSELTVTGASGVVHVDGLVAPQDGASAEVTVDGVTMPIPIPSGVTYVGQLRTFVEAIESGRPFPTTIAEGVRTMAVIDACYETAGLGARSPIPG